MYTTPVDDNEEEDNGERERGRKKKVEFEEEEEEEEAVKDPSKIFKIPDIAAIPKRPSLHSTLPKTFSANEIPAYHEMMPEPERERVRERRRVEERESSEDGSEEDGEERERGSKSNSPSSPSLPLPPSRTHSNSIDEVPTFHKQIAPPSLPPHLRAPPPRSMSATNIVLPPRPGTEAEKEREREENEKREKGKEREREKNGGTRKLPPKKPTSSSTLPRSRSATTVSALGRPGSGLPSKAPLRKKKKKKDPFVPETSRCGWTVSGVFVVLYRLLSCVYILSLSLSLSLYLSFLYLSNLPLSFSFSLFILYISNLPLSLSCLSPIFVCLSLLSLSSLSLSSLSYLIYRLSISYSLLLSLFLSLSLSSTARGRSS